MLLLLSFDLRAESPLYGLSGKSNVNGFLASLEMTIFVVVIDCIVSNIRNVGSENSAQQHPNRIPLLSFRAKREIHMKTKYDYGFFPPLLDFRKV